MKIRVSTLLHLIDHLVTQNSQVQTNSGALPRIRVPVCLDGCDEVYFDFKTSEAGKVSADMSILCDGVTATYPVNDFLEWVSRLPLRTLDSLKAKYHTVYCKKADSCVHFEFFEYSIPKPEWFLVG